MRAPFRCDGIGSDDFKVSELNIRPSIDLLQDLPKIRSNDGRNVNKNSFRVSAADSQRTDVA